MTLPVRSRDHATDPFREMEEFRSRMTELMQDTFGEAPWTGWQPPVDIEETDDAFLVEADVPGAKRPDIDVELRDNLLSIRGETKDRERVGILRRRTRRTGRFDYQVTLPGEVEADGVEAHLEDGVLKIHVPKVASARRRRIEVKSG